MNCPSRAALVECLAALREGRACAPEVDLEGLVRRGYALPSDGQLRLTMQGLAAFWRLRDDGRMTEMPVL